MKNQPIPFRKETSIRSKIMAPFMVIIIVLAAASIGLAILSLSNIVNKHTHSDLTKDSLFMKKNLEDIIQNMSLLNSVIPYTRNSTSTALDRSIIQEPALPHVFNWQDIIIYASLSELNTKQLDDFKDLISLGKDGKSHITPFAYLENNTVKMSIAAVTPIKRRKRTQIMITEYRIDDRILTPLAIQDGTHNALIYSGKIDHLNHTDIIASDTFFKEKIPLQKVLKRLISNQRRSHYNSLLHTFKLNKLTYTMLAQKSPIHPNLYTVSLKTSKEASTEIFNVIFWTLVVLTFLSVCIYGIYALIIQKITTSIDILSSVSEKIAKGDLDQKVYLNTSDEIGELANIFNQMVSNLKDSSTKLIEEKDRSEAIISCIPEGIIVTDIENRLILANQKAEKMFNFSLNEAQGKFLLEYINNEDLITVLNEKLKESEKPITHELKISDKEGQTFIYSMTSSIVKNQKGNAIGVISVLRDLTHEKQIEELREGFLRTVSHELRTPLTSVIGFIELVTSGSSGNISDSQKGYLETALKEASNLKQLIDDLLDLSQIKAGKISINLTKISLKTFIEDITHTLEPIATGKGLKLNFECSSDTLSVNADHSKLRRVLLNLLSNAIKFTDKGSIEVGCIGKKSHVEFYVKDTGIGLRDEEKEVIFEKFRQVDYSSRREYEGIGLGLSIVRQLVEMHEGDIWVESEYGKGATFTFTIKKGLKAT